MTNLQKIELELLEVRKQYRELSEIEEITDDHKTQLRELDGKAEGLELRKAAAIKAEAESQNRAATSGEGKELNELKERTQLRSYLRSFISETPEPAEISELRSALGVADGFAPFDLLTKGKPVDQERASIIDATDTTDASTDTLGRVFSQSASNFLGVSFESVPIGQRSYFVLTAGDTPGFVAPGSERNTTAASLTNHTLTPKRITANYDVSVEDMLQLEGLEMLLRTDLTAAINDRIDHAVLNGVSGTPSITGLLNSSDVTSDPNPTADTPDASFNTWAFGAVDGSYAMSPSDVKLLMNATTYSNFAGINLTNAEFGAMLNHYQRNGVMVRVSGNLPAANNNISQVIVSRTAVPRVAVVAVWNGGIQFIRDHTTESKKGEVRLLAAMYVDFAVLRGSAFTHRKYRKA